MTALVFMTCRNCGSIISLYLNLNNWIFVLGLGLHDCVRDEVLDINIKVWISSTFTWIKPHVLHVGHRECVNQIIWNIPDQTTNTVLHHHVTCVWDMHVIAKVHVNTVLHSCLDCIFMLNHAECSCLKKACALHTHKSDWAIENFSSSADVYQIKAKWIELHHSMSQKSSSSSAHEWGIERACFKID